MIFLNLIPHGSYEGLSPEGQMVAFIGLILLFLISYGLHLTVGAGASTLRDTIKEHARMHDLGIAHNHKESYLGQMYAEEETESKDEI
tara:strand:- start:216 stop:479 length:264 start_codon:yes stop_codon:yes gene_type:complete